MNIGEKMVYFKELIKGNSIADIPHAHQINLEDLKNKLNVLRQMCKIPFIITSGYRSEYDHRRIYAAKGITDDKKIPWGSKHLIGAAADILDKDGKIKEWVLQNKNCLEEIGLWAEDFKYTEAWLHLQTQPPKSGNRFFKP